MHRPVLAGEVLELMAPSSGERFLDGTVGSGGHARLLLERVGPSGFLYGIDRDPARLEEARKSLSAAGPNFALFHGNYRDLDRLLPTEAIGTLDGVLLDVGAHSAQLDEAGRGFSFQQEGPLDMRMDPTQELSAYDVVNEWPEEELADAIYRFGEERRSRRIARAIVREREREPIRTTLRLAEIAARASGGARGKIHPATRTFQGIRIAVNGELEALEEGLKKAFGAVRPGGRVAAISFHSLEDRIVKRAFRAWADEGKAELLTRKPVTAADPELEENRRSRSAKLRAVKRR